MRKVTILLWLAVVFLSVCLIIPNVSGQKAVRPPKDYYRELELFANVLSILQSDYVNSEDLEPKKLIYGALEGMVSRLDPYSQFLEPDEYKEIKAETQGEFGGLGVEIAIKDGLLTVVAPIEGTPASKAGIQPGDRVVRIDGKSTKDIKLQEAVKKLRGRPGTNVNITVLREDEKKLIDFALTRALIKVESIKEARIIDEKDKIAYIKLVEFQQRTPVDLDSALAKLKAEGMQSLILDLRNNPGGLLDVAIDVSERFVPKGDVIVSTKGTMPSQNTLFKSRGANQYADVPMIVLVNRGSASASEIVAGAVKDLKRGIILGTRTFGKGSIQTVIPLPDGSALRLTTARYYTPDNKAIHDEGIEPDVVVEQEKLIAQREKDIFEEIDDLKTEPEPARQQEEKPKRKGKSKEKKIELQSENKKQQYDSQLERAVDLLKGIRACKKIFLP